MPRPKRKLNAVGGYTSWANSLAKRWGISRRELEQDDYDYRGYYNSNPSAARGHLTGDSHAHFPDTYKLPSHPTFSIDSKYSGKDGNIVGGTWFDTPNAAQRWTYQLSPEQIAANWNIRRTLEYAGDAEDEGFRVVDDEGRYPIIDGVIDNGILPAVNVVRSKKRKGGDIHIDPENRGKFTETMRRTGKTAEELSHSSNPLTRKRAIFALNARKWHH